MEMIRLRCTSCGADFENVDLQEHQRFFRCTRAGCGAVFMVEQGEKFADVEQAEAEKIQKYRQELQSALEPMQDDQVDFYAHEILKMIPEDFRAQAFMYLVQFRQESSRGLYRFLSQPPECTEEEFEAVFPSLLHFCDFRGLKLMREKTVPQCVKQREKRQELLSRVEKRLDRLREESDAYAEISRDVFVCHSGANSDVALQVVNALEKDGNQCWISSRNLPPDERYYWEKIESAVAHCNIFLVICSEDAMQSHDVQRELKFAKKYKLARLELKCDGTKHTTLFKEFFEGIAWVDGTAGMEDALEALKKQVKDIRFPPDPQAPDIRVTTLTEQEIQERLERELAAQRARIAAEEAEKERIRKEQEEAERLLKEQQAAEEKKKAELEKKREEEKKKQAQEEEKKQREIARQKQQEEDARKARIAKQKRQCRWFTFLALALFGGRILLTRALGREVNAEFLLQQMLPGALYFLAVLAYERILLRHTAKPQAGMALVLLLPLALDFWYLTPLQALADAEFLHRALTYLKALLLLVAMFCGIYARKRYEKDS